MTFEQLTTTERNKIVTDKCKETIYIKQTDQLYINNDPIEYNYEPQPSYKEKVIYVADFEAFTKDSKSKNIIHDPYLICYQKIYSI